VAKSYEVLIGLLKDSAEGQQIITEQINPNLQKFATDDDTDVRYFANRAILAQ